MSGKKNPMKTIGICVINGESISKLKQSLPVYLIVNQLHRTDAENPLQAKACSIRPYFTIKAICQDLIVTTSFAS